jgi:hypothetical protein
VVYACHVVKPATQPLIFEDSTKTLSEYSELTHHPDCQAKTAATPTAAHSDNPEKPTCTSCIGALYSTRYAGVYIHLWCMIVIDDVGTDIYATCVYHL